MLAAGGGALMIVSDFLTLYRIDVMGARCSDLATPSLRGACTTSAGAHHGHALLVLGLLAVVMAWGAAVGDSRPAGVALVLLGAAGLAIALAVDLPDVHKTGIVGLQFASAEAKPASGLWLELAGAALVVAAGALRLLRPVRR